MDVGSSRYAYPDTNCNCNGNTYRNSHCNSYCDCHGDFHSRFYPNYDSTTNSDIYAYGYSDAYTQAACNAEGTTHSAAAPLDFAYEKQTHCSTPTSGREHAKNFGVRIA